MMDALKKFTIRQMEDFENRMHSIDNLTTDSLTTNETRTITTIGQKWAKHPAFLYSCIFPHLKYAQKYQPQYSFVSDGNTATFLFANTKKENAHRAGSKAVTKYHIEQSQFKAGTLSSVLLNREEEDVSSSLFIS